jgi:PAS domain S-box-containing protein
VRSGGTQPGTEYRLRRHDGVYRWHLGRAVPEKDEAGQIVQWVGTSTDIDEQKRTEEKLRQSERLYRAIGESIDYGVWVCDAEGKNVYASPSFLRLVGMTQEQCSEFGWKDVLHPDDAERTMSAWKECVRVRGNWDIEHRVRGVDGQWHIILARGAPVEDENGQVVCWAGINLDISRLKKVEQELEQTRDELELRVKERTHEVTQANQRIRRLAAQLATAEEAERRRLATDLHDSIGQSLSMLKLHLEPLLDQASNTPEAIYALAKSLELLDNVIKQTRTLMFDLYPSMLHDLGLVPTLLWYSEQLSAQAQVSVTEIGRPQTLAAPVVSSLFRATKELLNNALRHGRAREIIEVVHWRPEAIKIVIDDDGSGFEPEKVLAPHTQHGLGLAGIQERLVSFSGKMFIESNPGQGTRIALEIPLSGKTEEKPLLAAAH